MSKGLATPPLRCDPPEAECSFRDPGFPEVWNWDDDPELGAIIACAVHGGAAPGILYDRDRPDDLTGHEVDHDPTVV